MKLISWTLDGLGTNIEAVAAWIEAEEPVVVCLRATGLADRDFPLLALWELGYYTKLLGPELDGGEGAGGIAIVSVEPPRQVRRGAEGRSLSGCVAGIRILNVDTSASEEATRLHLDTHVAPHEQLLVVGAHEVDGLERIGEGVFANARLAPKCASLADVSVPVGDAVGLILEGLPPPQIPDLDITR